MKKNFLPLFLIAFFFIFHIIIHNIYAQTAPTTKIAILDTTPYLEHKDLVGKVVGGYNFVTNHPLSVDDSITSFHGTHIAGLIAGQTTGIYPEAHLLY